MKKNPLYRNPNKEKTEIQTTQSRTETKTRRKQKSSREKLAVLKHYGYGDAQQKVGRAAVTRREKKKTNRNPNNSSSKESSKHTRVQYGSRLFFPHTNKLARLSFPIIPNPNQKYNVPLIHFVSCFPFPSLDFIPFQSFPSLFVPFQSFPSREPHSMYFKHKHKK